MAQATKAVMERCSRQCMGMNSQLLSGVQTAEPSNCWELVKINCAIPSSFSVSSPLYPILPSPWLALPTSLILPFFLLPLSSSLLCPLFLYFIQSWYKKIPRWNSRNCMCLCRINWFWKLCFLSSKSLSSSLHPPLSSYFLLLWSSNWLGQQWLNSISSYQFEQFPMSWEINQSWINLGW